MEKGFYKFQVRICYVVKLFDFQNNSKMRKLVISFVAVTCLLLSCKTIREDKIWTNIGFKIDRPGYLVDTITIKNPTIIGVGHIFWVMEDSLSQKVQKELLSSKVNSRKSVTKYLNDSESAINDQNVFLIGSCMDHVHWDVV